MTVKEALVIAFTMVLFLLAVVVGTGSTFGQRCAKQYPNDPGKQDTCVQALAKGETL